MATPNKQRPTMRPPEGDILRFLYQTAAGRLLLKGLTRPGISKAGGWVLNRRLSARAVAGFVRRNAIDMTPYAPGPYRSFNAFFTRPIRPGHRPVDMEPHHLISPCDGKLSVFPITADGAFAIKNSSYTVSELLGGDPVAEKFTGGQCLVFRLSVDDYHRYSYPDSGRRGATVVLPGILHTVQPIALAHGRIYKRNSREYALLHTDHFGMLAMVEVGAMLVGRIRNRRRGEAVSFSRGEEKGMFEFGGSTIVLLIRPGVAAIDEEIIRNSRNGLETIVKLGEKIGEKTDAPLSHSP